ncbi:MAG: tetratricopeptide repeat protein, partial [Proteobacteria bacterium]|nr:tetratricopeptide repeat protein [Pseudomonadota bacterium]
MADSGSRKERRRRKKLARKSGGGRAADIGAVLQRALADHRAGRLDEAEQAYRQALSQDPKAF